MENEKFDKCVICGKDTQFKESDHISLRKHYIQGAGQLCDLCFFKVYGLNINNYNSDIH